MELFSQIISLVILLLTLWSKWQERKPVDKRSAFVIALTKDRSLKRGKAIDEKDEFATGEQLNRTLDELDALLPKKSDAPK